MPVIYKKKIKTITYNLMADTKYVYALDSVSRHLKWLNKRHKRYKQTSAGIYYTSDRRHDEMSVLNEQGL